MFGKILNPELNLQEKYFFNGIICIPLEENKRDSVSSNLSLMAVQVEPEKVMIYHNAVNGTRSIPTFILTEKSEDIRFLRDDLGRNWAEVKGRKYLVVSGTWFQSEDDDEWGEHFHDLRVTEDLYTNTAYNRQFEDYYDGAFYCTGQFV